MKILDHRLLCRITLLTFLLSVTSCVVIPVKSFHYDEECDLVRNKYDLEIQSGFGKPLKKLTEKGPKNPYYIPRGPRCSGSACIGKLFGVVAGAIVTLPVSAIISTPIALIGNAYYQGKESGQCKKNKGPSEDIYIDVKHKDGIGAE